MKICPKCFLINQGHESNCLNCNTKLIDIDLTKNCPSCFSKNSVYSQYCSKCGHSFKEEEEKELFESEGKYNKCPSCGNKNLIMAKYCFHCGEKLEPDYKNQYETNSKQKEKQNVNKRGNKSNDLKLNIIRFNRTLKNKIKLRLLYKNYHQDILVYYPNLSNEELEPYIKSIQENVGIRHSSLKQIIIIIYIALNILVSCYIIIDGQSIFTLIVLSIFFIGLCTLLYMIGLFIRHLIEKEQ